VRAPDDVRAFPEPLAGSTFYQFAHLVFSRADSSSEPAAGVTTYTGANPPPAVRKFVVCPWYTRAAMSWIFPSYT